MDTLTGLECSQQDSVSCIKDPLSTCPELHGVNNCSWKEGHETGLLTL